MPSHIAYLVSRFPKVSETFILYEILELEALGTDVEIFSLIRQQEDVQHPEATSLVERAHYTVLISWPVVAAQWYWLLHKPLTYLKTWWKVIWGNRTSWKFWTRALVVMPVASYFARQMQAMDVEHIHAHWATHPTLGAYVIHHLTGISYSFTAHAHDIYVDQTMLDSKIEKAKFVVTISQYNRDFLSERFGYGDKIEIIHCGIDADVFEPRLIEPHDKLRIITVASLEEKKGHRYLLEACQKLHQDGLAFECWLVGDGDRRAALEILAAKLGIADCIQFMGRQPREKVRDMLQAADVMVLPSIITASGKKEGIPVALMEALATELPVIVTDISGVSELVIDGKTGLLVPEKDVTALYQAIRTVQRNPAQAQQMAKAGRRKVLQEFNLRICVQQLHKKLVVE